MVAMQISAEPLVRQALRLVFKSRAVLSVKPTKKGRKVCVVGGCGLLLCVGCCAVSQLCFYSSFFCSCKIFLLHVTFFLSVCISSCISLD